MGDTEAHTHRYSDFMDSMEHKAQHKAQSIGQETQQVLPIGRAGQHRRSAHQINDVERVKQRRVK